MDNSALNKIVSKFSLDSDGKVLCNGQPISGNSGGSSLAIDVTYAGNGVANVEEALNKIFSTLADTPSSFVAGQNIKITTNGKEVVIDLNGDIDCGNF